MAKKSRKKYSGVDPLYLERQRLSLKRRHRKTVLFNDQELAAIDEYCKRFKIASRSALIRQAVMHQVLTSLSENTPTLF